MSEPNDINQTNNPNIQSCDTHMNMSKTLQFKLSIYTLFPLFKVTTLPIMYNPTNVFSRYFSVNSNYAMEVDILFNHIDLFSISLNDI